MEKSYCFIEDLDTVLARMGGSEALLDRLLVKFRDSYCGFRPQLLRRLASANAAERDEAYRMVHSMKGVSANLGIAALNRRAASLENRMKEGVYDAAAPELVSFLAELDTVLEKLG